MRSFRKVLAPVVALLCAACAGGVSTAAAEKEVAEFHARYDAGQFAQIWTDADDSFRGSTAEPDFLRFIGAVHRKLGAVQETKVVGTNTFYGTGGTRITLVHETTFKSGKGTEQFVLRMDGDSARLVGYHINSNALVID